MAERKPLTLVDNRPGELPASDNLPYTVLPQAWTHPSLGAPLGSMLVYAAIARGASPPDTFGYWATATNEAETDVMVEIAGTGYLGFDLVDSDRARDNLGLGDVATLDVEDLISTDTPNALEIGADGKLVATGGGGGPAGTTTVIRTGSDLQVGDSTSVEYAPADAGPWTGWAMTIHPAGGTAQVDVLVAGVSITSGGTSPNVISGTSDTGSTSGWAGDSISAGQSFEVQVTAVTGIVERIDVYLHP